MTVEFWSSADFAPVGRYFRSLLRELGYRAELRTFPDLHLILEKAAARRPQLGIWGWIADSAGPFNFLKPLVSCGGDVNLSRFCDPKLDAAMEQAAARERSRGDRAVAARRSRARGARAGRPARQQEGGGGDLGAGRQLPVPPAVGPPATTRCGSAESGVIPELEPVGFAAVSMEQVTERLRAAGLRVTAPRVSVLGVLDASQRPPARRPGDRARPRRGREHLHPGHLRRLRGAPPRRARPADRARGRARCATSRASATTTTTSSAARAARRSTSTARRRGRAASSRRSATASRSTRPR